MRAAVFSDVHGNLSALEAVLADAERHDVDEHWIVGDLVAHGPQPAETIQRLMGLSSARIVRGNTDRYVLTGDHSAIITSLDQVRTPEELQTLVTASSAHAWTRGCITTVGAYDWLAALPIEYRMVLPDGSRVLLVHASPGQDDGPGITDAMTDDELAASGWLRADADLIFVGHTHRPLDRVLDRCRVINLGSVSVPATAERGAMWTLVDAGPDGYSVERHVAGYDLAAVLTALDDARHPSADWLKRKFSSTA